MKSAAQLVSEAKSRIENLSVGQVANELATGQATLVDVREADERREGTIAGAIHIPRGLIEFYADPSSPSHRAELDPNKRILIHCAAGSRSALVADTLKHMGFANVAHLEGGFKAWKNSGQPVEAPRG